MFPYIFLRQRASRSKVRDCKDRCRYSPRSVGRRETGGRPSHCNPSRVGLYPSVADKQTYIHTYMHLANQNLYQIPSPVILLEVANE